MKNNLHHLEYLKIIKIFGFQISINQKLNQQDLFYQDHQMKKIILHQKRNKEQNKKEERS